MVNNLPANAGDTGSIPGLGRCPGVGNGTHSSVFAWEIPWTEKSGGLQSMWSQKVRYNLVTKEQHIHIRDCFSTIKRKEVLIHATT